MSLVCPYPGSPVATSWLSMLGCRGMQVLSANQVFVLVLSDLFFSRGDKTLGHVKLWALTAPATSNVTITSTAFLNCLASYCGGVSISPRISLAKLPDSSDFRSAIRSCRNV